jgi:glutathione S-transferase
MNTLKIYGTPRSRAFRTLWAAAELGLDYEHIPVDQAKGETRTPSFLAINPNGHVPVIEEDGFRLWESMAINLYLAKKYGSGEGGIYPRTLEDEARAWQWSFWGMTEVEPPLLTALFNRFLFPEAKRDPKAAAAAEAALQAPLKLLDGALGEHPYLLGERFSVADLNLAGILAWARPAEIDLGAVPRASAWLKTCHERPAARKARALQR